MPGINTVVQLNEGLCCSSCLDFLHDINIVNEDIGHLTALYGRPPDVIEVLNYAAAFKNPHNDTSIKLFRIAEELEVYKYIDLGTCVYWSNNPEFVPVFKKPEYALLNI